MSTLKDKIDMSRLPEHIAVIMDGNGRWAKQQGKIRIFGHQNGVGAVRAISEACAELGVRYLTPIFYFKLFQPTIPHIIQSLKDVNGDEDEQVGKPTNATFSAVAALV